jgi:hypothetical protein
MLYPRVTYQGPAHPAVEVQAGVTATLHSVELNSGRVWRGDAGAGRIRISDRHPRLSRSVHAGSPKRRHSLNEAAHKLYGDQ